MLKVGLTGGIGCGKSTAVDAFRVLGVPIIDADQIARDIVKPGQKALEDIVEAFGHKILFKNGELNRALLKKKIFSEQKQLEVLEGILHPRIRSEINSRILALNKKLYVIVDIPLLIEKNYQEMFDRIIVVDCLPEQQLDRVNTRDNLSTINIRKIMHTQVSREERLRFATDILDNTGDVDTLHSQIKSLHKSLSLNEGF